MGDRACHIYQLPRFAGIGDLYHQHAKEGDRRKESDGCVCSADRIYPIQRFYQARTHCICDRNAICLVGGE